MASELQRVAQGLVDVLDELPRVVEYLKRTAQKCRENAAYIAGQTSNPNARLAALQLDEAARRCDEAAHYASLAPQKARAWAEQMVSGTRTTEPRSRPVGGGASPPVADGPRGDGSAQPEGSGSKPRPVAQPADEPSPQPTKPEPPQTAGAGNRSSPQHPPHRDPEAFRPIAREILERLPVRGRRDKTRGVWIDPDGHEHDLISGIDEYSTDVERFIDEHDLEIAPGDITLGSHVEVKFAMRMRRLGLTDEIITINNRPCPGPMAAMKT